MEPHEKLRNWRETEKLSQAEAARRAGVSSATWFDWERGIKTPNLHRAPDLETLTGGAVTADEFARVSRDRAEARAREREQRKAPLPPTGTAG